MIVRPLIPAILAIVALLPMELLAQESAALCMNRPFYPPDSPPPARTNVNAWMAYQALADANVPAAIPFLEQAWAEGDPTVGSILGDLVERGICMPASTSRALRLYRQGAAEGDHIAMLRLGMLLLGGKADITDEAMATSLFRAVLSRSLMSERDYREWISEAISPRPIPLQLAQVITWAATLAGAEPGRIIEEARILANAKRPERESACHLLAGLSSPDGRVELAKLLLRHDRSFHDQKAYAFGLLYDIAKSGHGEAMETIGRYLAAQPSATDRSRGLTWLIAVESKGASVTDAIRDLESSLSTAEARNARDDASRGILLPYSGHADKSQPDCVASSDSWRTAPSQ